MSSAKNKIIFWIILWCLIIFVLSFLIHWYPIYKKGYPSSISPETAVLARNLALTGEYKSQNSIGTVLSTESIRSEGDYSLAYNKLTAILYSYIYKTFGFSQNLPLYISLLIHSLLAVILFILTYKLFNLPVALLQSLIFILLPIVSYSAVYFAYYEWALLFFSLALFFYLITKPDQKLKLIYLLLAGVFFTLASLSRSAFAISILVIFVYELFKYKDYRRLIALLLPLIIGWSLYLIPDISNNRLTSYFSNQQQRFSVYGHLFPDPYTFYFEKDEFLANLQNVDADETELLIKLGESVSFKDKVLMYLNSITFYPLEIFKIIVLGGPLILILLFIGFKYLGKERRNLAYFFLVWLVGWYLLFAILKTNNEAHFIEIAFPVSLLVSLGAYQIINLFKNNRQIFRSDKLWIGLFTLFLLLHLIQANKWMYHEEYNTGNYSPARQLADLIESQQIESQEVIAVNLHPLFPFYLNYFTNKSFVHFSLETVQRLLKENRLSEAFAKYNVKYIIGFNPELANQIKEQTQIKVID